MVFPKFTIFKFVFRKIILGFEILIVKYMFLHFWNNRILIEIKFVEVAKVLFGI
jgi:hypothetical protein